MAVPVSRRRRAGRRKMTGKMAEVKAKYTGEGPKAHGLRRKGRTPGRGARPVSKALPRAGRPTRAQPAIPAARKSPGVSIGTKSLGAMRAAAASRKSSATSGGATTPGTGPTPATTPRPGKSGLAASRTGRPPAHGARRQGKTPGSSTSRLTRPKLGTMNPAPVGSIGSSTNPKIKKARTKLGGRGRGRGY